MGTFLHKQDAHLPARENRAAIAGDAWVWMVFSPVDTLGHSAYAARRWRRQT